MQTLPRVAEPCFSGYDAYRSSGRGNLTPFEHATPRQAQLRKKTVGGSAYWLIKTGGETDFGRTDELSHKNAQTFFAEHLVKVRTDGGDRKRNDPVACERDVSGPRRMICLPVGAARRSRFVGQRPPRGGLYRISWNRYRSRHCVHRNPTTG